MAVKMMSRIEANREVRRVLVKHSIDTSKIQFSCYGRSLTLTGGLYKDGGKEIEIYVVEAIIQEIGRLGLRVGCCELDNWSITESMISKKGNKYGIQHQVSSIPTELLLIKTNLTIRHNEDGSEDDSEEAI